MAVGRLPCFAVREGVRDGCARRVACRTVERPDGGADGAVARHCERGGPLVLLEVADGSGAVVLDRRRWCRRARGRRRRCCGGRGRTHVARDRRTSLHVQRCRGRDRRIEVVRLRARDRCLVRVTDCLDPGPAAAGSRDGDRLGVDTVHVRLRGVPVVGITDRAVGFRTHVAVERQLESHLRGEGEVLHDLEPALEDRRRRRLVGRLEVVPARRFIRAHLLPTCRSSTGMADASRLAGPRDPHHVMVGVEVAVRTSDHVDALTDLRLRRRRVHLLLELEISARRDRELLGLDVALDCRVAGRLVAVLNAVGVRVAALDGRGRRSCGRGRRGGIRVALVRRLVEVVARVTGRLRRKLALPRLVLRSLRTGHAASRSALEHERARTAGCGTGRLLVAGGRGSYGDAETHQTNHQQGGCIPDHLLHGALTSW